MHLTRARSQPLTPDLARGGANTAEKPTCQTRPPRRTLWLSCARSLPVSAPRRGSPRTNSPGEGRDAGDNDRCVATYYPRTACARTRRVSNPGDGVRKRRCARPEQRHHRRSRRNDLPPHQPPGGARRERRRLGRAPSGRRRRLRRAAPGRQRHGRGDRDGRGAGRGPPTHERRRGGRLRPLLRSRHRARPRHERERPRRSTRHPCPLRRTGAR